MKDWKDEYLEKYYASEEFLENRIRRDREFLDFVVYGKEPSELNKTLLEDLLSFGHPVTSRELSVTEIIEKYNSLLSEEEIKKLKDGETRM